MCPLLNRTSFPCIAFPWKNIAGNLKKILNAGKQDLKIPIPRSCVQYFAAGDKAALAELYAQAKNPVYCFALSILRDSFAAEDVMQETFLQVWKSAPTYRPGGKNALT